MDRTHSHSWHGNKAALMTFSEDMIIRRSEKPKSKELSKPMAQWFLPPFSGAKTVCCVALIMRSQGTLLGGLHDDSQSELFYYAIFISSKTELEGCLSESWSSAKALEAEATSSLSDLIWIISQSDLLDSKWDKDSLKVLTEVSRSQFMNMLALLVGSLVIVVMKNERALLHFHDIGNDHEMRKRKKRCKALLLYIYKWSRQRASLEQEAASTTPKAVSSTTKAKQAADCRYEMPIKSFKGSLIKAGKQDLTELMMDWISKGGKPVMSKWRGKTFGDSYLIPFLIRKKKRFFEQLAYSACPTYISYLAEEALDMLEFLPSWDSMDQDLLLLYGQYQSTLVDHMDVEKASLFDELEASLFHFCLPSSYLCFVCSLKEFDLFNLGYHLNNYNCGQRVK
nr:ribosomal protein L10, mitochondrial [Tanacetum cinerariifolium]